MPDKAGVRVHNIYYAKASVRGVNQRSQPDGDRLAARIRWHITTDHAFACDACLALRFDVSLGEARLAALAVARGDGFMRKTRPCYGCGRTLEITSTVS